jgi:hypothetical protein
MTSSANGSPIGLLGPNPKPKIIWLITMPSISLSMS